MLVCVKKIVMARFISPFFVCLNYVKGTSENRTVRQLTDGELDVSQTLAPGGVVNLLYIELNAHYSLRAIQC
jgi:hypothetical protein